MQRGHLDVFCIQMETIITILKALRLNVAAHAHASRRVRLMRHMSVRKSVNSMQMILVTIILVELLVGLLMDVESK